MNNLDQSIRDIVSASIVGNGTRIFAAPAPVYGTMDFVYAAINSGTVTLKKNAENWAEFRWIKRNFKAICKNCVTLQRVTLWSRCFAGRRESLITA